MMVEAVRDIRCDYRTCGQGGKDFRADASLRFRACLHVHFAENLGKELHPMIIIHCKKLVVVPLGYLVTDNLSVYNGGHLILTICFCRLYGYLANFDLPAVFLFSIPAFALIEQLQVTPVHSRTDSVLHILVLYGCFLQRE